MKINSAKAGRGAGPLAVLLVLASLSGCAGSKPEFAVPPAGQDPLSPARAALASGNETSAIERLNRFLRDNPGSALVDEATYLLGRAHLATRDSDSRVLAADYFQRVLRDYPQSRFACDASFHLAESYYGLSRPSQLDQDWTLKAIGAYRQFVSSCPNRPENATASARVSELNNRLAKKAYDNGVTYMRLKLYNAATVYFEKALNEYPESSWACRAATGLGESYVKLHRWSDATAQLQKVVDTCPDPKLKSHARDLLSRAQNGIAQNGQGTGSDRLPAPSDTSGVPDSASSPR